MLRAGDDGMPPTMLKPSASPLTHPSLRFGATSCRYSAVQLAPKADGLGDGGGSVDDVVPSEPQHVPTRGDESSVALCIAAPVDEAVVELGAVDFDDDARAAKQEVDATDPTVVVAQVDLPLRLGQPVASSQLDEVEPRARSRAARSPRGAPRAASASTPCLPDRVPPGRSAPARAPAT